MQLSGALRQLHERTLDFAGPPVKESAATFRDCRPDVSFVHAGRNLAAEGDAADLRATDLWATDLRAQAASPGPAPRAGAWRAAGPGRAPAA
jgi:hypothetical protein